MTHWKRLARDQVMLGQMNPDHTPRYRVPARRWWQFWKPKWQEIEGLSITALRRSLPVRSPDQQAGK